MAATPVTMSDVHEAAAMSMWDVLVRTASRLPDRPAIVFGSEVLRYDELVRRALRCAGKLSEFGVVKGCRVAILFHSSSDWAVLHYALCRLGAVVVPVSLALESSELEHVLKTAEPEHVITIDQYREVDHLARFRAVFADFCEGALTVAAVPSIRTVSVLPVNDGGMLDPEAASYRRIFGDARAPMLEVAGVATAEDPAYVIFTSGSTAHPKPALLRHRSITASGAGYAAALRLVPDDRLLVMLPVFHITGPTFLAIAHIGGGAAHLLGHFDAGRALDEIEARKCTATVGFPTNITKLMAHPSFPDRDVSSFRKIVIGGTTNYLRHVHEVFDLELIATIYGSTESAGLVSATDPAETDLEVRLRTNGLPLPGVEVRIMDPETGQACVAGERGEILFRGVVRFDGYLAGTPDTENAIDSEGFFHSGDYGYVDEAGYLYYRGRYKMMVKTGGENVSELELELFLEERIDEIEMAQVVGAPDDLWGEAIVAFVQLRDGAPNLTSAQLRERCRGGIAPFKIPKRFVAMEADNWPVLVNGRLNKQALRDIAANLEAEP